MHKIQEKSQARIKSKISSTLSQKPKSPVRLTILHLSREYPRSTQSSLDDWAERS